MFPSLRADNLDLHQVKILFMPPRKAMMAPSAEAARTWISIEPEPGSMYIGGIPLKTARRQDQF